MKVEFPVYFSRAWACVALLSLFLLTGGCSGGGGGGNEGSSGDESQTDSGGTNSRQGGDGGSGGSGGTSTTTSGGGVESDFNHPDSQGQTESGYNSTGNDNWDVQDSTTLKSLARVWGTSASNVYAVGILGTVVHFDGANWSEVDLGTDTVFTDVWGGSANNVYITGYNQSFHYDGQNWQELATPNGAGLSSVWVAGSGEVFVLDLYNRIYQRNADGSWRLSYDGGSTVLDLHQIRGTTVSNIYVAGFPSLHFDGSQWSRIDLGSVSNGAHAVWVNPLDVFLLNEDVVYYSTGSGWSSLDSGANVQLKGIWAGSLGNIYISGSGVYHFNGAGWSSEIDPRSGLVYGLWGASATDIFGVGEAGRVIRLVP